MGSLCAPVVDNSCLYNNFNDSPPNLTVFVRGTRCLPEADWKPGIDRYLYVGVGEDVGGEEYFRSQLRKNVVDPVWNEECELPAGIPLIFSVLQTDVDGNTEVVSWASLDLVAVGADGFNGELPLKGGGMLPGGILLLKAKTENEYPSERTSAFIVSIDNAKKKNLGLELDSLDPEKLFVNCVKKGIIMDKRDEVQPENNVEAGCFIVGVAGDDVIAGGCLTGHKVASRTASGSEAMLTILKQNPTQIDLVCRRAMKFRIALTLTEKQSLGARVPTAKLGNSLVITEIEANGPLEAWNNENPDQVVEPWDRIVEVNGKAGKVRDLEDFVRAAQCLPRVLLTIARMLPEGE